MHSQHVRLASKSDCIGLVILGVIGLLGLGAFTRLCFVPISDFQFYVIIFISDVYFIYLIYGVDVYF
ncbi:unnamed protein product [Brassica oleracea]